MFRLILVARRPLVALVPWMLCRPVLGGEASFVPAPGFIRSGPAAAAGALVWIHGTYGRDASGPPEPPDFVHREAAEGLDVWCLNRDRAANPIPGGAEALFRGVRTLRAEGYRRIVVAGHSRGAWIALTLLAHPGLADTVVAFSPAAHGTREERKAQAMREWEELWKAGQGGTRVVLVQLSGDPWDPDPVRRLAIARQYGGDRLLSVFQPEEPRGHAGVYEPAFDARFGADIARYAR